jgi:RNA 2',3'-cyclic 3'-phosphodiesterase
VRLFVALDLPLNVRQELEQLVAQLSPKCPSARWVRPEGIHITLKFIGYTDAKKLDALLAALEPIRSPRPLELEFRGLGFFPNERRPRVLWCGVEAPKELAELVADIELALESMNVPPESRPFVPHLTLARFDSGEVGRAEMESLARAAEERKAHSFGSARATEFYLYESVLKRSGAEYKRLHTFPFLKGPA